MKKSIIIAVLLTALCSFSAKAQDIWYQGEVEVGYSLGVGEYPFNRLNLQTIHGARFGDYFSAGAFIGFDYLHESEETIIPIGINLKGYYPIGEGIAPYLYLDLGYGIYADDTDLSGLKFDIGIGMQLRMFKVQLGYDQFNLGSDGFSVGFGAIQLKLGIMF
ncbi:MAG: hypothetical protein IKC17_01605 [Bacteroidales bacterium]|nr:hypothetical protein [Bacteroidales bacterium]